VRDRWGKIAGRLTIVAISAPLIVAVPTTAHAVTVTEPDCNAIWQRSGSGFYESNPTYTDQRNAAAVWKYSTPEVEGMKSVTLNKGIASLAANKSLRSVVVVRHGNITYEAYPNGGGPDKSDNIHSASKSMLQALIGIAVQRGMIGSLDDKVSRYLPTYPNGKQITLRNLLSMRSGLNRTKDKTENEVGKTADWVGAILDQGATSTPGPNSTTAPETPTCCRECFRRRLA
jgi:CubicO group peptidase (beta-lactamase class C family)